MSNNTEDILDWLVALDIQHYKTEEFPDYKPNGASHFYLLGSPERFTSEDIINIYNNTDSDELMRRWNFAIIDKKQK